MRIGLEDSMGGGNMGDSGACEHSARGERFVGWAGAAVWSCSLSG